ncbi:MAG: cobalt-precorrin-6A reductase [Phyllobacterium sp.]
MSERPILILGGTAESALLARTLVSAGHRVISSLAGRTTKPSRPEGEVRVGGFGGPEGLASFIRDEGIAVLIDATHPFAERISDNAIRAAEIAHCAFVRLERPAWKRLPDDNWIGVPSLLNAVSAIPANANVLLALGRQHIAPFANRRDVRFTLRMIEPPDEPFDLPAYELVLAKPGSLHEEEAFLRNRQITHIICRNSGGSASYAKIEAARQLGLPVIMIDRPKRPSIHSVESVEDAVAFVETALGQSRLGRKE